MAKTTMYLDTKFDGCPAAWRNFIDSFGYGDEAVETPKINAKLKQYNGHFKWSHGVNNYIVVFNPEEGYSMFLLRWHY